jgi:hypothetical protein
MGATPSSPSVLTGAERAAILSAPSARPAADGVAGDDTTRVPMLSLFLDGSGTVMLACARSVIVAP